MILKKFDPILYCAVRKTMFGKQYISVRATYDQKMRENDKTKYIYYIDKQEFVIIRFVDHDGDVVMEENP